MRISDWSSDVCSSDLQIVLLHAGHAFLLRGFESPLPESNPVFAAVDVLLRNATIYFSMISGIIYARIFCSRPYAPFMKARLVNTGVPYLAITAFDPASPSRQFSASIDRKSPRLNSSH